MYPRGVESAIPGHYLPLIHSSWRASPEQTSTKQQPEHRLAPPATPTNTVIMAKYERLSTVEEGGVGNASLPQREPPPQLPREPPSLWARLTFSWIRPLVDYGSRTVSVRCLDGAKPALCGMATPVSFSQDQLGGDRYWSTLTYQSCPTRGSLSDGRQPFKRAGSLRLHAARLPMPRAPPFGVSSLLSSCPAF